MPSYPHSPRSMSPSRWGCSPVGVGAVDEVVAGHQRPGPPLAHGDLKGGQVDLAQRFFIDDGVVGHAPVLLAVAGEVLGAGEHAAALDAADHRRGQLAGEIRVFGIVFKAAAAQGRALDVHARAEQYVHVQGGGLRAQRLAHALHELHIPAAAQRRAHGEAGGGVAAPLELFFLPGHLPAQAVGAVGHDHGGNAQPGDGLRFPEVFASQQQRLFGQGHLADQVRIRHAILAPFLWITAIRITHIW